MSSAPTLSAAAPQLQSLCGKLSVVIIGRNEAPRLARCLQSVQQMTPGPWQLEILYVDSGSTDNSLALAQAHSVRSLALHPERPTAAIGRNAGWRAAGGDFILFLDGDTLLHPNFVLNALPSFADTSIACVWGHRRELHPQRSLYNRVLDLDWIYAPGFTPFCGGDALFRRSTLEDVGGFDETLIAGEEPELCRRITASGQRILHIDQPMTLHDLAITRFSQYWKRATRAGHAYAEVSSRFANTPNPFWTHEVRRNRSRALLFLILFFVSFLASLSLHSVLPALAAAALFAALVVRTAWKARWKSPRPLTLLLYAIHSHLQQIPIAYGQATFYQNRHHGRRVNLVEYKRT
jgi:cellulose synthase/poly-beta-1,6-N-acetylglucosamine synthase-like glycosyltransferase